MMGKFKPQLTGEVKVKRGRHVMWLSRPSNLSMTMAVLATVSLFIGVFVLGIPVVPMVVYAIKPAIVQTLEEDLTTSVTTKTQKVEEVKKEWQPPVDNSLPEDNWIEIEKIGLKTLVREASLENFEEALRLGVWRVPDFGTAENRRLPMILAAHRYGYLNWSNTYRKENSFFNLPKLEQGDKVYVVWEKRKYVYEIYKSDTGKQITDYEADLILYTCQYLESPIRIFKYARLIKAE